jgi:hypothetical protein
MEISIMRFHHLSAVIAIKARNILREEAEKDLRRQQAEEDAELAKISAPARMPVKADPGKTMRVFVFREAVRHWLHIGPRHTGMFK